MIIKMKIRNIIYPLAVGAAMLAASATPTLAKTVDILGITSDGQRAQLKGKLNLDAGKSVSTVTTYSYNMTDGYAITSTSYEIVTDTDGSKYITADVNYYPDEDGHTYRIELQFTDGTKYTSEVVTADLTEAFMWLGDYGAPGQAGWNTPVVDKEVDPSLTFWLGDVHYYKTLSNHAPGHLLYTFPEAQFTRFVTKYGVQDDRTEGDIMFKFFTGTDASKTDESQLTAVYNQMLYSKSNPNRPAGQPYVADIEIPMDGIKVLRLKAEIWDWDNYGDHANYALPRLYLPVSHAKKDTQTVTFSNAEQNLTESVTLNATASSGGKVFYRIISGRDLATLEGNVIKPVWGGKGTVIVEATQYGNDSFYPATDYHTFYVDMQPTIEMLGVYRPSVENAKKSAYVHLLLDTKGKKIDKLTADIYNEPKARVRQNTTDLMSLYDSSKDQQIVEIEVPEFNVQVLRIAYRYANEQKVDSLPYWHIDGLYDYMSDLPSSAYTYTLGWGQFAGPNKAFNGDNNGKLSMVSNPSLIYAKGLGLHASGKFEVKAEYLAPYYRLKVDMGAQVGYGGNTNQKLSYQIVNGNTVLKDSANVTKNLSVSWDTEFNNQTFLRLVVNDADNNDNDHVCIGAPRLYYTLPQKMAQTVSWENNRNIIGNKTTRVPLTASASSELPVWYRIVKGSEFATIEGNDLVITSFPNGDNEIIVDAYQPGDGLWAASPTSTCTFSLARGLEIQKNEYVEVSGPDTYDMLVVHADKESAGQLAIKNGIIDVRTIELHYIMQPGEWNYISFPSDVNIDNISNLNALGYSFNAFGAPSYILREFDTTGHENNPFGDEDWRTPETPVAKALKGYTIMVDDRLGTDPVEVIFTIDNAKVDMSSFLTNLGLTLDLSHLDVGSHQTLTVTIANPDVTSNQLTIDVLFEPTNVASLPLNHQNALDRMRFVFVGQHRAIRLTLPDPTPARVVFFDRDGKKIVKAVRYIAPNVIDLSDLKPGTYNMTVGYGPAIKTFPITL